MISELALQKYLNQIVGFYKKERRPSRQLSKTEIERGRARCVAAKAEDAFADLICRNVLRTKAGYKVFVDFPITIKPRKGGSPQTRYIDFVLCRRSCEVDYEILYMAELKLNTGWIRDRVVSFATGLRKQLKLMSQRKLSSKKHIGKGGKGLDRLTFSISKSVYYDLIILSAENNNCAGLKKDIETINNVSQTTQAMILTEDPITSGCRTNEPDRKMLDERIERALGFIK